MLSKMKKSKSDKIGFFLKFLVLALLVVMIGASVRAFYRFQNPETSATFSTLELKGTLNLMLAENDSHTCDPDTSNYKVVYSWERLTAINTWESFTQTEKFLSSDELEVIFGQAVDVTSEITEVPKGTYRVKYKVVQVMQDGRLFRIGEPVSAQIFQVDSDGKDSSFVQASVHCK